MYTQINGYNPLSSSIKQRLLAKSFTELPAALGTAGMHESLLIELTLTFLFGPDDILAVVQFGGIFSA